MKKAIAIGVASLVAVGLLAGFAAREHRDPQRAQEFMSKRIDRMLDRINATPEQRAKIGEIKDQMMQQGMALRQAHHEIKKELMAQWQSPQVDAAKIHAMVDQRVEEFRARAQKAADAMIQLHDVLTPEQRAQLEQELSNHHRRHAEE